MSAKHLGEKVLDTSTGKITTGIEKHGHTGIIYFYPATQCLTLNPSTSRSMHMHRAAVSAHACFSTIPLFFYICVRV